MKIKNNYGYRQITKELRYTHNIIYNSKKVLRIIKENNIQTEFVRKMRRKQRKHRKEFKTNYSDLLNRNFNYQSTYWWFFKSK